MTFSIRLRVCAVCLLLVSLLSARLAADDLPNPYPRPFVVGPQLHRWDFADGTQGWQAANQCTIEAVGGVLRIQSSGNDPYLIAPAEFGGSELAVRIRMRLETRGDGQLFWASSSRPGFAAHRQSTFPLNHDGQWHEYTVPLETDGDLTSLRLDPGMAEGEIEVDWIELYRGSYHPLEILRLERGEGAANVVVRNHGVSPVDATVNGRAVRFAAAADAAVPIAVSDAALASLPVVIAAEDLPPIERHFWIYRSETYEAAARELPGMTLQAAPDGSLVRLLRQGVEVAALAPLVHADGELPALRLVESDGWPLIFAGEGLRVTLAPTPNGDLAIAIDSRRPVEGPVVRTFGGLEQGLLAGVEYLGRGEHSSSKLDIQTEEHLRVEPDPMHLTMPLMAFVTDRTSVAMIWDDTGLQPTYAAPDFVDYSPGHRMSLKGQQIRAELRVAAGWEDERLEDAILWAVRRRGLPPLPEPPRSFDQQMQLSLAAYRGLIHDSENGGWFHAVVPGVRSMPENGAPLADCASAIFRITGQMPEVDRLQLGGAHVRNSTSFFVSGRAAQWLQIVNGQAEQLRRSQQPDGSYRYGGKYRRGHFEDTASGLCARSAFVLLEHARYTGNHESLAAGLKTLEFIKRFRTPRGSQTWEIPLHTPDILASAQLVWAYARAYQLTGDPQHLDHARRWAITGLPFVYQWSNQPIMAYATIAVYGATDWQQPNWIGLPVQWCGTVYAHALLMLAPHDQTVDWRRVAEGILISGEQQQYSEGPSVGCLPDVFDLPTQQRLPADINPGVLVDLRLQLAGQQAGLAVAHDGVHRVVSPFPVTIRDGHAHVQAVAGQDYQVLIDGHHVVDVSSQGEDVIALADR